MISLWFGGGEVSAHRALLAREGVGHIAVNLSAYLKQRQAHRMSEAYDGFKVILYSSEGGLDPNKVSTFIETNIDKFDMVYGLPCDSPVFVPEWAGGDLASFYALASQHPSVGLTEAVALDQTLMPAITAFVRREGINLVTASSKQDALAAARWHDVIMTAWLTASKHRELQVWDGRIVRRYARLRRTTGMERHGSQIERIGVSLSDLRNDEPDANLTLAVRSWQLWSKGDNVVPLRVVATDGSPGTGEPGTAMEMAIATGHPSLRTPPVERERVMLPLLGLTQDEYNSGTALVKLSGKQLRTCDSCFLAQHCPSFQPHHECAYDIPVKITNKTELQAVKNALLEMQVQRIGMSRLAEDLLSQGLSPETGSEMDRFFRMLESIHKTEQNTESLMITAKTESGVLSRLFGEKVGAANRQLGTPIHSDALMEAVLDGEVVGEPPPEA